MLKGIEMSCVVILFGIVFGIGIRFVVFVMMYLVYVLKVLFVVICCLIVRWLMFLLSVLMMLSVFVLDGVGSLGLNL